MVATCIFECGDRATVKIEGNVYKGTVIGIEGKTAIRISERTGLTMNEQEILRSKNDPFVIFYLIMEFDEEVRLSPSVTLGKSNTDWPINSLFCKPLYEDFGGKRCPVVTDKIPVISKSTSEIIGRFKGIQGHYNSCYLDSTLFGMFAFNSSFDDLLWNDHGLSEDGLSIQKVLRNKIVNPLRRDGFVRADRLMELRELLDKHGSVSGLTDEEKDPEEFLTSLLIHSLTAPPLLKLSTGQDSHYYQIFVDKHDGLTIPSVQYLLEESFYNSDVKLSEVPTSFLLLMPRFGKQFKVYDRLFPPLELDVSEIVENCRRVCSVCGQVESALECRDCFQKTVVCSNMDRLCAFCETCSGNVHQSNKHDVKPISRSGLQIVTESLELFAVVCIEVSHYVSFVKCGEKEDAPWCFFDSMADHVEKFSGDVQGYNIPEISECPHLNEWLSEAGYGRLRDVYEKGLNLEVPPLVKRLLNDAALCMYRKKK